MTMHALVKPLLGIELFNGLKPLQITEILRRADRIVYKAGDVIMESDTPGDAAVLIIAGEAMRLAGPLDAMPGDAAIPTGALLGEMAMLIETSHASTIVAKTPVRALRLSRSELHAQMAEDPSLADHLVQRIAARLHRIADELRDVDGELAASMVGEKTATFNEPMQPPALH
jgi:CRP-like cAMP-binding protein